MLQDLLRIIYRQPGDSASEVQLIFVLIMGMNQSEEDSLPTWCRSTLYLFSPTEHINFCESFGLPSLLEIRLVR